jgi:adenosylmethionine-8-amino-7-oxononanoate aminotransferase
VLIGERVRAPFWDGPPGTMLRHGYTYSGHATGCAAALANIEIIEREALVDRVRRLEPVLEEQLGRLAEHPGVAEVRVAGLTGAVELTEAVLAEPGVMDRAVVLARTNGVLTRNLRGRSFQISPPFVIDESEIRQMVDGLEAAISEVVATAPAGAAR